MSPEPDWYQATATEELHGLIADVSAYQVPPLSPLLHEQISEQVIEVRDRLTMLLDDIASDGVVEIGEHG